MFLVLKLIMEGESNIGLKIKLDTGGMAGMLPVFVLRKDAVEASCDGTYRILEIETVPQMAILKSDVKIEKIIKAKKRAKTNLPAKNMLSDKQ